jgi:maltoporin
MKMKPTLLAAAALSLLSTTASAVDWGGYTRIGPGQKQASGDGQRCFNGGGSSAWGSAAPGHGGIGRLGNECETYAEFALSQGGEAGGVNYKTLLMTAVGSPGSVSPNADGNTMKIAQLYVEGKGFDVAPNVSFWVGRRFYHRADVHFDDSFYVMGGMQDNAGAGADGIDLGVGSLGVAVFRRGDSASTGNAGTLLNFDLQGINVNPGGKLRATASFAQHKGTNGENGSGLSFQHNQANVFGADNTLFVQWSKGTVWLDMGFTGNPTQSPDSKRWRIADSLAWTKGPLTAQTLVHYGNAKEPNALGEHNATTFSLAGRAAYAMTKNFKLQGELGFATTKSDFGGVSQPKQNVTKLTIAPTLTVGPNYYDRPELRFYVSMFNYNDGYKNALGQSKSSKTAAGFQAEIWF